MNCPLRAVADREREFHQAFGLVVYRSGRRTGLAQIGVLLPNLAVLLGEFAGGRRQLLGVVNLVCHRAWDSIPTNKSSGVPRLSLIGSVVSHFRPVDTPLWRLTGKQLQPTV